MSGMRKDNDMRILISNDDGIFAPGLMALVRAFSAAGHTVYVAAPDSQRSAASHSMTLFQPLTARARAVEGAEKAWAIDGTPVDCVKLAVKALCLILSALGITNRWWGVFADVGVMILAVLNATRMLTVKEYQ